MLPREGIPPPTAAEAPPGGDRLDPAFMRMAGVLLLVLLLALLMALLDETIVNVGVKTLTVSLHSPLSTIQWVTGGYLLAVAVAAPFAGWAVDRFGGRTMWLTAVTLFVAGSLLSGLAWSPGSLIGFRLLQGLGGGMIVPVVQSVLAAAAGPSRVAKAMGLISIPLTLGPILGPIVGGALVDSIDWRWMFLINVPIGLVALLLALRTLPADQRSKDPGQPLDVLGLVLLSPGFAALVFGLTTAGQRGDFTSPEVLAAFAVGAVLLAGYVVHALRTKGVPLIDLRMFTRRGFSMAVVTMFFVGSVANTVLLLTPLYYQQSRGFTALHAGLLLIPSGLLGAAGAITARRFQGKIPLGRYSTAQEVAGLVGCLEGDTAASITAQAMNVCGGLGNY